MSPYAQEDSRVTAAARALSQVMGTPKDWRVWMPEAKAVISAADRIDPLRKESK